MFAEWPCPLPDGGTALETALAFDRQRQARVLVIPALFDEANKLRRLTVETMRRLDGAGIDCILPDLPGCGESLQLLENQTLAGWRDAMAACARHFSATHTLTIRGGGLLSGSTLPAWRYAPLSGRQILRQLIRGRIVASREQGCAETHDELIELGMGSGIELAGYRVGANMIEQLQYLEAESGQIAGEVPQDLLGGAGLWLRAEPGEDRAQADALAAIVALGIAA